MAITICALLWPRGLARYLGEPNQGAMEGAGLEPDRLRAMESRPLGQAWALDALWVCSRGRSSRPPTRRPRSAGSSGSGWGCSAAACGRSRIVPEPLQVVGRLTLQAWANEGFVDLVAGGGGLGAVGLESLVLLGFAAVLFTVGALRLRPALGR